MAGHWGAQDPNMNPSGLFNSVKNGAVVALVKANEAATTSFYYIAASEKS